MSRMRLPKRRGGERRWQLNTRLLAITAVLGLAAMPAGYFWHAHQVRKNAIAFLDRATALEEKGNFQRAAENLNRYLQLRPDDHQARVRLAQVFDRAATDPSRKIRAVELYTHALGLAPDQPDLRRRQAELLLELDRYAAAEEQVQALLRLSPNDPVGLRVLALARHGAARTGEHASLEQAVETYRQALDRNPADVELAERLAGLYREELKTPDPTESRRAADAVMNRLIAANPHNAEALLARYRYRLRYALPDVDEDLDQALQDAPQSLPVLLTAAERELRRTHAEQARGFYERAVAVAPAERRAYLGLSRALTAEKKPRESIDALRRGLKQVDARDIPLNYELLRVLIGANELDEAGELLGPFEKLFESIAPRLSSSERLELRTATDLLEARWSMGKKDYAEAIQRLNRALTAQPVGSASEQGVQQAVQAWALLASCHAALGRGDLAAAAYERVAQIQPAAAQWWLSAAQAHESCGHPESALRCYQQAAQGDKSSACLLGLARMRLREQMALPRNQRNWAMFEKMLTQAAPAVGDSWDWTLLKANAAVAQGQQEQALEYLRAAEEIASPPDTLWQTLALAYEELGQTSDADRACDRFAQARPSSTEAVLLKSDLLSRRQQFDQAIAALDAGIQSLPVAKQPALELAAAQIELNRGQIDLAGQRLKRVAASESLDIVLAARAAGLAWDAGNMENLPAWEDRLRKLEGPEGCAWRCLKARRTVRQLETSQDPRIAEAAQTQADIQTQRPAWPQGFVLKAELALRRDNLDEAIEAYQQAVSLGEKHVEVYQRVVDLLLKRNRLAEADKYLSRLREANRAPELSAIGEYVRKGDWDRAVRTAEQLAKRNPKDAVAQVWLAQTLILADRMSEAETVLRAAIQLPSEDSRAWLALVQLLSRSERPDEARAILTQLAGKNTLPAAECSFVLAQGYELIGDVEQAGANYRQAIQKAPDNVLIHERYASFSMERNPDEAQRSLRRVVQLAPDAKAARRALAAVLAVGGNEDAWQEAWKLLQGDGGPQAIADRRLQALMLSLRGTLEDREQALRIMESLVNHNPRPVPADRLLLARLYENERKLPEARKQLETLAQSPEPDAFHLAAYADLLLRHGPPEAIKPVLEQLDRLSPRTFLSCGLRARWLKQQGLTQEAEAFLKGFLTERLATRKTDYERAQLLWKTGDLFATLEIPASAEVCFRQLYALSPERFEPLARFFVEQNRTHEAVVLCVQAAGAAKTPDAMIAMCTIMSRGKPSAADNALAEPVLSQAIKTFHDDVEVLFAAATLRYFQERHAEAITLYEQILKTDPQHTLAMNNLAHLLSEQKQTQTAALNYVRQAISIKGPEAELLDTLGMVLLRRGEHDEAAEVLEEAVSRPTPDPRYHFHLALVYERQDRLEKAGQALAQARQGNLKRQPLTADERVLLAQLEKRLSQN